MHPPALPVWVIYSGGGRGASVMAFDAPTANGRVCGSCSSSVLMLFLLLLVEGVVLLMLRSMGRSDNSGAWWQRRRSTCAYLRLWQDWLHTGPIGDDSGAVLYDCTDVR